MSAGIDGGTVPPPSAVAVRRVEWPRSVRIVASRYPPVGVFDRVASSREFDSVFALEAMTNDRIRAEIGELGLVPRADRVFGEGTSPIMAAFTHPRASRFSDGRYGVYYCADTRRTALRESVFHRERFLANGGFDPMDLEMREYRAPLAAGLYDLRGRADDWPAVYDRDDYTAGQRFGEAVRALDAWGIVYDSVRDPKGGHCAGLLRPPALAGPCVQGRHLIYRWDGQRIAHVFAVTEVTR